MDQKSKFNEISKAELHSVEGGLSFGGQPNFLKQFIPRTPPTAPLPPAHPTIVA